MAQLESNLSRNYPLVLDNGLVKIFDLATTKPQR